MPLQQDETLYKHYISTGTHIHTYIHIHIYIYMYMHIIIHNYLHAAKYSSSMVYSMK